MPDLTKLVLHSNYPAFKNNQVYTGTLTISGSSSSGTNTKTFTVPLNSQPDFVDIIFNGPADSTGIDQRPASGWSKSSPSGAFIVWVRGDNAGAGYTNYPTGWVLSAKINGSDLVITATYTQTFTPTLTLTSTNFSYRVVDYSTTRSSNIAFDSRLNYLKRSEFVGSDDLTLGAAGATTTKTITHGLGYIPFVSVGSNLNNTTIIWSNYRVHIHTQSSIGGTPPTEFYWWVTTTQLVIKVVNGSDSGIRTVHWAVYLDYET